MTRQARRDARVISGDVYGADMSTDEPAPGNRVRGDRLRQIRKSHPGLWTRERLSAATDVSGRTIARAENGDASFETVERLALALGVSPWLLWRPLDPSAEEPPDATPGRRSDDDRLAALDLLPQMDARLRAMADDLHALVARIEYS